jgi:hypothetical protein
MWSDSKSTWRKISGAGQAETVSAIATLYENHGARNALIDAFNGRCRAECLNAADLRLI